jgi:hypothetical protein
MSKTFSYEQSESPPTLDDEVAVAFLARRQHQIEVRAEVRRGLDEILAPYAELPYSDVPPDVVNRINVYLRETGAGFTIERLPSVEEIIQFAGEHDIDLGGLA